VVEIMDITAFDPNSQALSRELLKGIRVRLARTDRVDLRTNVDADPFKY
jgi:hypothetical protein